MNPREQADCGVRALAIACDITYEEAYTALAKAGRKKGGATYWGYLVDAARTLGFDLVRKKFTPGTTLKTIDKELPSGRWLAHVYKHYVGIDNGEVKDWAAGSKRRIKFVAKAIPRARTNREKVLTKC